MPNRLADAISPYLRSHADNPVHWQGWGVEAFAEARRRDVPVLVSIGYSTCHWCHVMARESFSDPDLAEYVNEHFVSIKVDREEHPDVDAAYIAAASAFTPNLGWPLNVFVTPEGRAFFAGTYSPPEPIAGHASFRQVLEAVAHAWATRRTEVDSVAATVAEALSAAAGRADGAGDLPDGTTLDRAIADFASHEDLVHGGFGAAPKFPVAPTLGFLLSRPAGHDLALRTLRRMGASPLRDPVEGGFFRYAVNRDWSEPHYERMLYDNAQLLELYTRAWTITGADWARSVAGGIVRFLTGVMQLPSGGFASAQDSESVVDGRRVEGGYYALGDEDRLAQVPPALDEKVLTGWNGLAVSAVAKAGFTFGDPGAIGAARRAADFLLDHHRRPDGTLVRTSIDGRVSPARPTLEDYGMSARGLLDLALATGEVRYASAARSLVDGVLPGHDDTEGGTAAIVGGAGPGFRVPNGQDPVLAAQGLAGTVDPSEGAYPSGLSAAAGAAWGLYQVTGDLRYREAARAALAGVAGLAPTRPIAFGNALRVMSELASPVVQLVVVSPEGPDAPDAPDGPGVPDVPGAPADSLHDAARRQTAGLIASVTHAQARALADDGFDLFAGRTPRGGHPTAYLCRDFVCLLPVTDPSALGGPAF